MTCHDAREWLGALIDDAIAPARRAEVEAHLLVCAECRLELGGLRATVGLLRRVEPVRAPAGFVDRVVERVHPAPWYRRVAAWLFLPLSIKLPAEAAAIVAIAGLAMLLIDRTPELRDAARVERPATPPMSAAPSQPFRTPPGRETRDAPGEPIVPAPPVSRAERIRVAPREKVPPAPPVARGEEARVASSEQIAPAPAPAAAESFDEKRERSQMERKLASPSAGRVTGLSARPADVGGRLQVRDRGVAVAALPDLLSKVGGSETARRQDGPDVVIEVLIPEVRYDDFARSLETLGVWNAPGFRQRVMLDSPYLRIPIRIAE